MKEPQEEKMKERGKTKMNAFKKIINNHLQAQPPLWYDMLVTMNINIKKGQKEGYVHIPCAFETLTHSIDFNPSLIKTKTNEEVAYFDAKEKWKFIELPKEKSYRVNKNKKEVHYNPSKFVVRLTEKEEKKLYELNEIERCNHCGQRIVIAELKETQYKSCPIISVTISDPAKKDLIIPVKFGVARAQFYRGFIYHPLLVAVVIYVISRLAGSIWLLPISILLGWTTFFATIRVVKLLQWYIHHRPTAEIVPKQPFGISLAQQMGVL